MRIDKFRREIRSKRDERCRESRSRPAVLCDCQNLLFLLPEEQAGRDTALLPSLVQAYNRCPQNGNALLLYQSRHANRSLAHGSWPLSISRFCIPAPAFAERACSIRASPGSAAMVLAAGIDAERLLRLYNGCSVRPPPSNSRRGRFHNGQSANPRFVIYTCFCPSFPSCPDILPSFMNVFSSSYPPACSFRFRSFALFVLLSVIEQS